MYIVHTDMIFIKIYNKYRVRIQVYLSSAEVEEILCLIFVFVSNISFRHGSIILYRYNTHHFEYMHLSNDGGIGNKDIKSENRH